MKAPHVVVLFAYHFPPEVEIGAARPFRFQKYLKRLGYACHVITAAAQNTLSADVHYVADPFALRRPLDWRWQLERAVRKIFLPGAVGLGWAYDAANAAEQLLRPMSLRQVTVISTFPPMGVHYAAKRLARRNGWPWIADFRDPMGGIQLNDVVAPQTLLRRFLEGRIIKQADRVIANTDASQVHLQQRFPERAPRIHAIWNGFDPEVRLKAKPLPERPYRIVSHTGSLYGDRYGGPILAAFDRLFEAGRIAAGSLKVRHVGNAEAACLGDSTVLARGRAKGWLEVDVEAIPLDDVYDRTSTADYLLLILPHAPLQVSGKLFEYLQVGRPILAYVLPDSPVERMLIKSGVAHRCIYPHDSPSVIDQKILEFLTLPAIPRAPNAWFEETFNGERQTRALAELIEQVQLKKT